MLPYEGEEVTGINLFSHKDTDYIFEKEFPDFIFYRYAEMANDISSVPHEKGDAIEMILNYYGFNKDDAVGFGDDLQDISMAKEVGTFFAMGNGKEELKKIASYVCPEVWNDGVFFAINEYCLK